MKKYTKKIKSPLRYPGGKQKIASQLISMFPEKIMEYREPMGGGCSVFLIIKQMNLAERFWINDISAELISFWRVVQSSENCVRLVNELEALRSNFKDTSETKAFFNSIRTERTEDEIRRALLFFFKNRVTFSGTTEAGGFSPTAANTRFTKSSIDRIAPITQLLEDVKITSGEFDPLIEMPGENVFLFLDPPHYKSSKLYGPKGHLNDFAHDRLANLLKCTSHRFLMTLDDCLEIRSLYDWANIRAWDVMYGMTNCNVSHIPKRGSELIISNYEILGNS